MRWALALVALMLCGCTIQVDPPNIHVDCIEVVIPGENVCYCAGRKVPCAPSPSDAGNSGG